MINDVSGGSLVRTTTFQQGLVSVEEEARLLDIIKTLANAKSLKITNHADALALCVKAKELDIPMGTALDHCFIVNGKVGIDVHIAKAKLLGSNSISWEKVEDYVPVLNYTDGKRVYKKEELPENFVIISKINGNDVEVKKCIDSGKVPFSILLNKDATPVVVSYRTTYKFTRIRKMIDGSFIKQFETSSFSTEDAISAGLIAADTSPSSPWIKYRKLMLDHRAFVNGARAIGDDLLLGMYSDAELLDMNNKNYIMSKDGTVTLIDD